MTSIKTDRPETTGFWRSVLQPSDAQRTFAGSSLARALLGVLLLLAIYGLAAGFFQGGRQVLVSALKFPLLLTATLLLCLPSLCVFAAIAGARFTLRHFLTSVLGFAGRLALLAVAMVPIVWLFSVSTQYLFVAILMHVTIWGSALLFSQRALVALHMADVPLVDGEAPAAREPRSVQRSLRGVALVWLMLVFGVGLQVATVCRPVLLTPEDGALFETGKRFFFEHFGEVADEESP